MYTRTTNIRHTDVIETWKEKRCIIRDNKTKKSELNFFLFSNATCAFAQEQNIFSVSPRNGETQTNKRNYTTTCREENGGEIRKRAIDSPTQVLL